MAKIIIAELDIDVKAMIASTSSVKKVIDDLKKSQSDLAKNGDTNSKAFVENAANLKVLNSEYTAGIKALADNTKATADQTNRTELLKLALDGEVTSIAEAREQNKLLNKLRNDANATTTEGQAEIKKLNNALDANNEFIKENADAYLKQKINIGNYSDSIKDALQNLNPFNGGIAGFTQRAQEAGGAGNLMKTSLQGVTSGVWGMIKASLAFIATPIGAVIAVVAGAAMILYSVFAKLDPVMDKIEQLTAALGAAFDTARQAVMAFVTGAKSLTEAFSGLGGSMASAAKSAAKLKEAQQELNDALSSQEVTNAKASQMYDELILKSKNKTLTEKESIAFINQAQGILEANYKQRTALANAEIKQAIEAARIKGNLSNQELGNLQRNTVAYGNYLLNAGRISQEEFDTLKKAELGKIQIDAEATSRAEKAQNREDKLNEDAQAKREKANEAAKASAEKAQADAEKIIDKGIEKSKVELDFFIESQGIKAKSLADELKLAEQVRDKKITILKTELENGKITQSEYNLESLKEKNSFLQKQAEVTSANAQQELTNFINTNKSKLDANKFLSDELLNDEISRLGSIGEAQKVAELAKIQSKQDLDNAILAIDAETKAKQDEILNAKTAADLEKNAIDQENKIAAVESEFTQKQLDLDRARQLELDSAEKTGADIKLINEKYAKFQKEADAQVNTAKLQGISQVLGAAASLFKENTLVYKALSIAQISIDTILSAQAAYKSLVGIPVVGPTLAPIGAGIAYASGALNIAKVSGIKFEKGGIQEVGGQRHAQGGTKFYGEDGTTFEAEKGEGIGVLNRGAFSAFMDFNNNHSSGGTSTPTFMAGGGIITQGVQSQSNGLDMGAILDIISSMPAPVVAVTDIHTVSDNYVRVVNGADF
jgi:hypothetical protein